MINAYHLLRWLSPLSYTAGCCVALWAFWKCRKEGYLILAAYFALAVFYFVALPPINRAMAAHRKPDISIETEKKLNAAIHEATQRVLAEAGVDRLPAVVHTNISFDGTLVLVIGLWLVAWKETKPQNQASDATSEPAPIADSSAHQG